MSAAYLDTSVLAKWYLNEPFSEQVEEYLWTLSNALISSLTIVEMRSLLLRRRRSGELASALVERVWATFMEDRAAGVLTVLEVGDEHIQAAARLLDRVEAPLRTLDAMHLALAESAATGACATADRILAAGARELGLEVRTFFDPAG
ncbi:MAG TPA: type II toxin-antitoxin system VapC family toxin [Thermoanaerobaculia bacterium]|nr:type II toxin-antitoxin system VapC family toxin [Thermoanaerobaculia bacterium]